MLLVETSTVLRRVFERGALWFRSGGDTGSGTRARLWLVETKRPRGARISRETQWMLGRWWNGGMSLSESTSKGCWMMVTFAGLQFWMLCSRVLPAGGNIGGFYLTAPFRF